MDRGVLPEVIEGSAGLLLRRWVPIDAADLERAISENVEHLRPWMPWIAYEPMPAERRAGLIGEWEDEWKLGGDVYLGVFLAEQVVGSCGLHRRIAPDGLEIGYWIHSAFLRRGLATEVARLLTGTGLSIPGISHVEIHHDKANRASAGIPLKLGYQLVSEVPDEAVAPAEVGIACHWRMTQDEWDGAQRHEQKPP
jgi:RimJ/RimL family protein N-acetyltransferase